MCIDRRSGWTCPDGVFHDERPTNQLTCQLATIRSSAHKYIVRTNVVVIPLLTLMFTNPTTAPVRYTLRRRFEGRLGKQIGRGLQQAEAASPGPATRSTAGWAKSCSNEPGVSSGDAVRVPTASKHDAPRWWHAITGRRSRVDFATGRGFECWMSKSCGSTPVSFFFVYFPEARENVIARCIEDDMARVFIGAV